MFLHLPVEPLRVKRGAAVDNHVGRRVIPVKKPSAVVAGERRHAVTRAEYVVGKAGAGVGKLFKFIIHRVGRAVEIAVDFLCDHLALPVDFIFREAAAPHEVGKQLDCPLLEAGGRVGVDHGLLF